MSTNALHNINFPMLVKMHGGDAGRAMQAWQRILQLGRFGSVPHTYAGGLDLGTLRVVRDELDHGGRREIADVRNKVQNPGGRLFEIEIPDPASADEIKQIEDIAAGDRPKQRNRR